MGRPPRSSASRLGNGFPLFTLHSGGRHEAGYFAPEVLSVVVTDRQHPEVRVSGEPLHGPHVSPREDQCGSIAIGMNPQPRGRAKDDGSRFQ